MFYSWLELERSGTRLGPSGAHLDTYLRPYLRGGEVEVWCIIQCRRGLPVGVSGMRPLWDGTLQKWSGMDPFGPILDLSRPHFGAQDLF